MANSFGILSKDEWRKLGWIDRGSRATKLRSEEGILLLYRVDGKRGEKEKLSLAVPKTPLDRK